MILAQEKDAKLREKLDEEKSATASKVLSQMTNTQKKIQARIKSANLLSLVDLQKLRARRMGSTQM